MPNRADWARAATAAIGVTLLAARVWDAEYTARTLLSQEERRAAQRTDDGFRCLNESVALAVGRGDRVRLSVSGGDDAGALWGQRAARAVFLAGGVLVDRGPADVDIAIKSDVIDPCAGRGLEAGRAAAARR